MVGPIIAAFANAAGLLLNKFILSYQKVGHRQFIIILFLFLTLICFFLYPFLGKIEPAAFSYKYLFLLILVIVLASIYNILFYHGIEKEKIAEVQLIIMLTPLSTIIVASIFLQAERNWSVFFAGIIASLALLFSHLSHYHLRFTFFQKELLLYILLYPIEAVLIKNLLHLYSPLAMYFFRTLGVFVVLSVWFLWVAPSLIKEPKTNFLNWKFKNYTLTLLISALAVIQMVLIYYGYRNIGVIFTTIVLTLAPILTYFGSAIILKERLKKRIVIAAFVILLCIVYANLALAK